MKSHLKQFTENGQSMIDRDVRHSSFKKRDIDFSLRRLRNLRLQSRE